MAKTLTTVMMALALSASVGIATAGDTLDVNIVVSIDNSSAVELVSSQNPSLVGGNVTFTATVIPTQGSGAPVPTGNLIFNIDDQIVIAALDANGQATATTSFATLGDHPVFAHYLGDSEIASSTSFVLQQRVQVATTTSVSIALPSTNPSDAGDSVDIQIEVLPDSGASTPTGTVTLYINGTPQIVPLFGGSALVSHLFSTAGSYPIVASYSGDATHQASISDPPLIQVVNPVATITPTIALSSSLNPSLSEQSVTFTATVGSPSGNPTGTVTFVIDDGVPLTPNISSGAVTLIGGSASYTPAPALTTGTYTVTATYSGDSVFTTNFDTLTQVVNDMPTLSIAPSSINEGNAGTSLMMFTVSLSSAHNSTVTVDYVTSTETTDTATAGVDYVPTSGTLIFPPGALSQPLFVPVIGDTLHEGNETFTVTLNALSGAPLGPFSSATGTITNDDALPVISIAPDSAGEAVGSLSFDITLSAPSGLPITVRVNTATGTAGSGDFTALTNQLVTFTPGDTSETVTVTVNDELIYESDETFTVALSSASNANISLTAGSAIGTIQNDDAAPELAISPSTLTLTEGDPLSTLTVTLAGATELPVTVTLTPGGSVVAADYTLSTTSLTFNPGETSKTADLTALTDSLDENDETLTVTLTNPTDATLNGAASVSTITIQDNTALPSVSVANASVTEGNAGTTQAVFTVSLSAISDKDVTVTYATTPNTADAADYDSAATGQVTITAGTLSNTFSIAVNGDTTFELNETFTVTISAPVNANLGTATATATINNDDAQPTISIADASVTEGNSGTVTAAFTVTLSNPSSVDVTVNYVTTNGSATLADNDYQTATGTLTILAGATTGTINVTVNGDSKFENNETFTVTLSAPTNATIPLGQGTATGTIVNDDSVPALSIAGVTVTEGDTGTTNAGFVVSLSNLSAQAITVNYATIDGTATVAGNDYLPAFGVLTIPANTANATINIPVVGDTLNEANESFTVSLFNPSNATINVAQAAATITNDDAVPVASIANAIINEGNAGFSNMAFTVSLSKPSLSVVTVQFATTAGTASAGTDFVAASGTVVFAPGVTSQTVDILVVGDTTHEADETFTVGLSAPVNATASPTAATGTITNDDAQPTISIANATVVEGNSGTVAAAFAVTLSNPSSQAITVNATLGGVGDTAASPSDYPAATPSVTIPAGSTTGTINVSVNGDLVHELDETFTLNLTLPGGTPATLNNTTATGTIVNDDAAPTLSVNSISITEGNTGTVTGQFTATLSRPTYQNTTINFQTVDGSATLANSDYVTLTGSTTINAGQTTANITVTVNGDTAFESNETFTLDLTSAFGNVSGTATITNDDNAPPPTITQLSPNSATVGDPAFTLVVDGTGFVPASIVRWNGANRVTTYISSTQLIAFITTADVSVAGNKNVTVLNPVVDGGASAAFTFVVNAATGNPDAQDDIAVVAEDSAATTIDVLANDSLAPNTTGTLSITTVSATTPNGGTATTDGSTIDYTPAANFHGTDIITYQISDGGTGTDSATVVVVVTSVNDDPTATDDNFTVAANSNANTLNVLTNDTILPDVGETLTVTGVTQPANGTAAIGAGNTSVTFTPDADFVGNTSFDYSITDGNGGVATATVNITVAPAVVTIVASNNTATEAGLAKGAFTITRTGSTDADLDVTFAISGTATEGTDYALIGTTATIPAGQNSVVVQVSATQDSLVEGDESVIATLSGGAGYAVGAQDNAMVVILDDDDLAILSGPTATPNPTTVGTLVTFMASANAANATYTWDFGDTFTSSGSSVTHAYAAAGEYDVKLTVTGPDGKTVSVQTTVTVGQPNIPPGFDTDGDGFSDELEIALGSDPLNPNGNPFNSATPVIPKPLIVTKMQVALNFAATLRDSISVAGTLPVTPGFAFTNQKVAIDVGGVVRSFTLSAKGKNTPKGIDSFAIQIKPKNGLSKYSAKIKKATFSDKLADEGLTNANATKVSKNVTVTILFNNDMYQKVHTMIYSAKQGKSGRAK